MYVYFRLRNTDGKIAPSQIFRNRIWQGIVWPNMNRSTVFKTLLCRNNWNSQQILSKAHERIHAMILDGFECCDIKQIIGCLSLIISVVTGSEVF